MLKSFTVKERSWIFYDWANSAFAAIIMASILPVFFKTLAEGAGVASNLADSYWGYTTSLASACIALFAPLLGSIGDLKGMKMKFFRAFLILGVLSTASLFFVNSWNFILVFYGISFIGFAGANIFYDAFIVDVTTKDRLDRVSTYGYALGYIGGSTIPFVLSLGLILGGQKFGLSTGLATKISFLITAVWWISFSIPILKNVKQENYVEMEGNILTSSFKRLFETFRNVRKYKKVLIFLLAYFLYIDGVNTIISMAAVFGKSANIGSNDLLIALLATQIVAFPCAILYGKLAHRFDNKKMILFGIGTYMLICLLAFRVNTAVDFWIVAMLVATSQGGIQGLSRSYFGQIIPKEKANEFFGFYDVFGKFAAILGPTLFAVFSQIFGHSRFGVLSTLILFIVGGSIFWFGVVRKKEHSVVQ